MTDRQDRPAPLAAVLTVTFAGSLSGGVFWQAIFFLTAGHYRFSPERNLVLAAVMGAVYAIAAAGAGILFLALAAFMIVLAVRERPWESAAALATLVAGGVAYAAWHRRRRRT